MPFKSEKQRRWMWANKPSLARKWSKKYGPHPKRRKKKRKRKRRRKSG